MMGKLTVYIGKEQMMLTREQLRQTLHRRPGRAVARIPTDTARRTVKALHQSRDVSVQNRMALNAAHALIPIPRRSQSAQRLYLSPEKRRMPLHQLEAILIGGIMAAGYLNAAIHIARIFGMI